MTHSQESLPVRHDNESMARIDQMIDAVISDCNTSAIFGTIDERRDYAIRIAELKSDIVSDDRITSLEAGTYIRNLERGVAEQVGVLADDLIKNDKVTNDTLDALSALPVPAPAFAPVIKDLYSKAIDAHEAALKANSPSERNARLQTAEDITVVATRLGRDIPEIKEGRAVVAQSGSAIHGHHLKAVIREAKTSAVKSSAVNSFLEMGYAHRLNEDNPILKKIGITAATAAVTGLLMSAAPVGAAHADAKIEKIETKESQKTIKSTKETVVLPAAAPAPDKEQKQQETKPDKAVEIPPTAAVAPKTEVSAPAAKNETTPNVKTDIPKSSGIVMDLPKSENKPTEPALVEKDKTNSVPVDAPKDVVADNAKSSEASNSTGNKSTTEKTESKNVPESTKNKAEDDSQSPKADQESGAIKIDIPDSKNEPGSINENPASDKDTQDKSENKEKILDHLKEDGPIAMSLDDVKKMTKERKDDDDEPKGDSDDKKDEVKVETIAQQNTQPTQKEKFNKEITKLIGGNGPIAMSLDDVKKMTKERKDDDKSNFKPQFEFAPSAELPPPPKPEIPKPATEAITPVNVGIAAAQHLAKVNMNDLPAASRNALPKNTNWDNAGRMLEYLMVNGGLTDSQAIGVVANAMWESSGVNPGQSQVNGPAFGLVQWEGGRRQALEAFAAAQNKPAADLYVQLDFMLMELKRDAWNGYAELKAAQNSSDATLIFMRKFERPGIPHEESRLAISKIITDLYNEKWQTIEKTQAEAIAAQKAAEAKATAEAEAAKKAQTIGNGEAEPFNGWHNPLPANIPITSQFGVRGYDAQGNPIMHTGADFGAGMGTPYYAAAGGVVTVSVSSDVRTQAWCQAAISGIPNASMADISDPYQKEVRVTTKIGNDEYVTIYAHMSQVDVAPGQIVKAGQSLGKTGDSGCSLDPHAHFEVRKNGIAINPNIILGGAINVSSSEIKVSDDGHSYDDHEHGHSDHEHPNEEEKTAPTGVGAADPDNEQKKQLEAIKKVAELKRRMAEAQKASEGYLAIR